MNLTKTSNRLIHATSPYLLQHAHNPVDWFEWGTEALDKATKENKPILVSIGYSSCHWCHVMERESFENNAIAAVMNEFFVCIKVDREERPDIDHIYMEAVQAMGTHGGWPLNVFLTPDQKPFYGGTYFPPQNWEQMLRNINKVFNTRREEIQASAEELKKHLSRNDIERFKAQPSESELIADLEKIYIKLESGFDKTWGGMDRAPKFVMPSVWLCLLRNYYLTNNPHTIAQVLLTLKRIAMGGIYDQIGGGFARYSVDEYWFAPHFEKMLYDNAQLLSLYAEAYAITGDNEFKTILNETREWLAQEMTSEDGGFYSALDADSEGVEGKFYVWKKSELEAILGSESKLICDYYHVSDEGNWEHGNNILTRRKQEDAFLKENNLTAEKWATILADAKLKLNNVRNNRPRPGLDDKVLTAWNAMMVCGLVDAYKALGDDRFLSVALKNMRFLNQKLSEHTVLYRSFKAKRSVTRGFLDDYAYFIQACLKLYEVTFDELWVQEAAKFLTYTLEHFHDASDGYFNYSDKDAEKLIAEKKEIFDNVIPSSNSVMAMNLLRLGILLDNSTWKEMASSMTLPLANLICTEPNYMSNWGIVLMEIKKGMAEVVMVGHDAPLLRAEFQKNYTPFSLLMGAENSGKLPLVKDRQALNNLSTIYVCFDKACQLPVHSVENALKQLTHNE